MKKLNLENINSQAPYKVVQMEGYSHLFYFHTDYDVDYEISIKANDTFIRSGSYALDIRNIFGQRSPGDAKVRQTLMAIIEEFFSQNNDVLLYITETEDGKYEKKCYYTIVFCHVIYSYGTKEANNYDSPQ
jgi:hypothetical protein